MGATSGPTASLRTALAGAVRSRVAGDAPDTSIFTARGPRWFPEGAAIRTVHADAAMFVGGLRALVLQSLHPLAMAGVAGHSGYRGDPWGRLQRTSQYLAATTFGSVDVAERAVTRVRTIHDNVRGTAPDGRAYRASDPHLLRWVHISEVDSFLRAHRRFGARPLTPEQRDEYVAEVGFVAAKLGVLDPPQSVTELGEALGGLPTGAARDAGGPRHRPVPAVQPADSSPRPAGLWADRHGSRVDAASVGARHAAPASPAADRRRPGRPARRRAGDQGVPLDVDRLVVDPVTAPTDLTRWKHCGNRRETGPPYGASCAAEPPQTRPPPRP